MIAKLLLGSNLGDSRLFLAQTVKMVETEVGQVLRMTDVLQNKAWGYKSQHDFFNQIVEVETMLTPIELLDSVEAIERRLGRRKEPCDWKKERLYQDRTIDIDILTCSDPDCGLEIEFENDRLKIPHPRMNEREFVQILLHQLF